MGVVGVFEALGLVRGLSAITFLSPCISASDPATWNSMCRRRVFGWLNDSSYHHSAVAGVLMNDSGISPRAGSITLALVDVGCMYVLWDVCVSCGMYVCLLRRCQWHLKLCA